jgi:hypothetical protein
LHIIESLKSVPEDLEVRWLAGWFRSEYGFKIKLVTRGISTSKLRIDDLPIGWLPALAPGRVISSGQVLNTAVSATPFQLEIPNLADFQDHDAADSVPKSLYSFDGHWGWGQRVLRYKTAGGACLIPATELIRFLFLHNSTMANNVLHAVGLPKLAVTPNPGHYEEVRIDFTFDMPVRSLDSSFAREFAWIAIDPLGRRSWDSVRKHSVEGRFLNLIPPAIATRITFRGTRRGSDYLVLELLKVTGRRLPCDWLEYSHPALQQPKLEPEEKAKSDCEDETRPKQLKQYVISANGAAKRNVSKDAIALPREYGTFENDIIVRKLIRGVDKPKPLIIDAAGGDESSPDTVLASDQAETTVITRTIPSSVDESDIQGELRPLELKLLETAPWDFSGETKALAAAVRYIAELYYTMRVGLTFCYLKPGRAFSIVSRGRRTCLIATFYERGLPLTVILDVDHSGLSGLSGLLLRYKSSVKLAEVEGHIRLLLDGLVDNGGAWDSAIEVALQETLVCERLPRMMRKQGKRTEATFVKSWVDRLIRKVRNEDF